VRSTNTACVARTPVRSTNTACVARTPVRSTNTAFSCREFTDEPVTDADITALVELARFAPSGGNRQPWRVVAVRDAATKRAIRLASEPAMRVYMSQVAAGEAPWNTIDPTAVDVDERWHADDPVAFLDFVERAPVLLVVGVDLSLVASFDQQLDRVGVISGASVYPFVWNLLLAARDRGLAGALTTMASGCEADVQHAVGLPSQVAVAAVIPIGWPQRRLTRLSRRPPDDLLCWERWE
jgi:nitroreductase